MVSSPLDFDASDYTEQDDFILGDNSETTPSTSNINVSNINIRENLKTSQESKNFSELDIDVQVYSSNTLQENYLLKVGNILNYFLFKKMFLGSRSIWK